MTALISVRKDDRLIEMISFVPIMKWMRQKCSKDKESRLKQERRIRGFRKTVFLRMKLQRSKSRKVVITISLRNDTDLIISENRKLKNTLWWNWERFAI